MRPMGMSINALARDIAVPPGRISAIVNDGSAPGRRRTLLARFWSIATPRATR